MSGLYSLVAHVIGVSSRFAETRLSVG